MNLRKTIEKQKKTSIKESFWICLIFGFILLIGGIILQINDSIYIGINLKYQQPTILNSALFFIGSTVFFIMAYFLRKKMRNTEHM